MQYYSILYESSEIELSENQNNFSESLKDLNLDQIIQEIVRDRDEYDLEVFFCHPLKNISAVNYRLEVMRDLENSNLYGALVSFAHGMKKVRDYEGFSISLHNKAQCEKWKLDAAYEYCKTLLHLYESLCSLSFTSKGFQLFSVWLTEYIKSDYFHTLLSETEKLEEEFKKIQYAVVVYRDTVTVTPDTEVLDYSAELTETFKNFLETTSDTPVSIFGDLEMCLLETKILSIVENMYEISFQELKSYAKKHMDFISDKIRKFDRELQFYISYLEYIAPLKRKGYSFSLPEFSSAKNIHVAGGYDIALAVGLLELLVDKLKEVKVLIENFGKSFNSVGLISFCSRINDYLAEDFMQNVKRHIHDLKYLCEGGKLILGARLGKGLKGTTFVLRKVSRDMKTDHQRGKIKRAPNGMKSFLIILASQKVQEKWKMPD